MQSWLFKNLSCYKTCFEVWINPSAFTVCPQPLDRDIKALSNNNQEQNNRKYSQAMRKAEADVIAAKDVSLFSTSSISSSFQEMETKEIKQLTSSIFTSLPHFTDLTTYMIKNIINFGKALTMFRWILWPCTNDIYCALRFCSSLSFLFVLLCDTSGLWL